MEIWCHCYDDEGTICDVPAPFSLVLNHLGTSRHPPGGILLPQSQPLMLIYIHRKCCVCVCVCACVCVCGYIYHVGVIGKQIL